MLSGSGAFIHCLVPSSHSQMGFCINREPDIWFQWHYQNRTSSPAARRWRAEFSYKYFTACLMTVRDAARSCMCVCVCVCVCAAVCLYGYMSEFSAWPFPNVCEFAQSVCVDSFWGWCWPTCLSGLSARTKFSSPPACKITKNGRGRKRRVTHPSRRWNTFLPLSVFLSLPPCLLIGIIEMIFSRAALFLCQAHLFFSFPAKNTVPCCFPALACVSVLVPKVALMIKHQSCFPCLFVEAAVF